MEMVQLLITDHYPVALLNNISLDKSINIYIKAETFDQTDVETSN